MNSPANYKLFTISLETVWGNDRVMDKAFTDYLDEYSIVYKVADSETPTENGWPLLEYTAGPIALANMLQEKFGYNREDIEQQFPEIVESLEA